jgi:hypothetical protein
MNTSETDRKLRKMIQGIRLESPGPDFTSKVMETLLAETRVKPGFVTEPLLGKRFWILVTLFIGLAGLFLLFQGTDPGTGILQPVLSKMFTLNWTPLNNLFSDSFIKTGSMVWTLIIVMLGASGLIFADKIFTAKHSLSLRLEVEDQ